VSQQPLQPFPIWGISAAPRGADDGSLEEEEEEGVAKQLTASSPSPAGTVLHPGATVPLTPMLAAIAPTPVLL